LIVTYCQPLDFVNFVTILLPDFTSIIIVISSFAVHIAARFSHYNFILYETVGVQLLNKLVNWDLISYHIISYVDFIVPPLHK